MKKILNNKYLFVIILVIIAAVILYYLTKGGKKKAGMTNYLEPISSTPNAMVNQAWCDGDEISNFSNPNLYTSCINAVGICEQDDFLAEWQNHIGDPENYVIGSVGCGVEGINYQWETLI